MRKPTALCFCLCLCLLLLPSLVAGSAHEEEPPRITANGDGTFTDNETGRVWLRDAACFRSLDWSEAVDAVAELESGQCGLADGSRPGDWRLPSAAELASLADAAGYPHHNHAAASQESPEGGPFAGGQRGYYWSTTSVAFSARYACWVRLPGGEVGNGYKQYRTRVWPVRAGP